jgi:O-antigen ligase
MFIETTVSTLRFGIPRMTHNAYVAYLCGNGIVGLALFLTVVVSAARNFETAARAARSDIKMRNLSLAWQSVLLFLVLVGLKSDFHAVKILWMSFGLSNALLASTTTERFTQPRAVKTKRSVSLPSLKPVSVHARGNEGRE